MTIFLNSKMDASYVIYDVTPPMLLIRYSWYLLYILHHMDGEGGGPGGVSGEH